MEKVKIDKIDYDRLLAENERLNSSLKAERRLVSEITLKFKDKQSQLDLILDSTKDYIALMRKKGDDYYCESHNLAYFNGAHKINPELKREQLNGVKMTDIGKLLFWPESVFEGILEIYEKAFDTREAITLTDILPAEIGNLYLESTYTPIFDHDGNPAAILFTSHDITSFINTQNALEKSEERFVLAMEASKDGLFDWDLKTDQMYYSPSWKKMLGYADDELGNSNETWEKLINPADLPRCRKMIDDLINKRIPKYEIEFSLKHKDGTYIEILSHADAVFDDEGKAIRVVGTHSDITKRKRAETNLKLSE